MQSFGSKHKHTWLLCKQVQVYVLLHEVLKMDFLVKLTTTMSMSCHFVSQSQKTSCYEDHLVSVSLENPYFKTPSNIQQTTLNTLKICCLVIKLNQATNFKSVQCSLLYIRWRFEIWIFQWNTHQMMPFCLPITKSFFRLGNKMTLLQYSEFHKKIHF